MRWVVRIQQALDAKPAYDLYDEGRKALAEDRKDEALSLANEALKLFPAEANFHALRGDIRLTNEQYDMAITNYDRAIARRSSFFYYYVQRGLAHVGLHDERAAVEDLEHSIGLLPTAPAHYNLGVIRKEQGRTDEALQHFNIVARSRGEYGKAAIGQITRLEIEDNPEKFVSKQCSAGTNNNVVVVIGNETTVAISGVRVQLDYSDNYGNTRREILNVGERIEPGRVAHADTGIRVYEFD